MLRRIAVVLVLAIGCSNETKVSQSPPEVALRAFELASAGDWSGFERDFVIPEEAFRRHLKPGVDGIDAMRAEYLREVREGFAALRSATSPEVEQVQDDGKHGLEGSIVEIAFKDASGAAREEGFRIYGVGGHFYVWDLD